MTWLKSLKSLVTRQVPNKHTLDVDTAYTEPVFLKSGKWVSCSQGVGIVTDLSVSGCVGIDLCDVDGTTLRRQKVPASEVILAKFLQIPESRRPASAEYAASLGYN